MALLAAAGSLRAAAPASMGTDFWVAMIPNADYVATLSYYITSIVGATGTVSSPGTGFSAPFTVAPNSFTQVVIPSNDSLGDGTSLELVENKGFEITSDNPVAVYGMNFQYATSDMFLGLPDTMLGTDYFLLSYEGGNPAGFGTEAGVVATQNSTTLTVTLPVAFNGHAANTPYTVNLSQGQTYFIWSGLNSALDFSGGQVQSNLPVGVYAGNECGNIPVADTACDLLIEELFPVNLWGNNYLSEPLATRSGGDTFRVLASQNNTNVSVNGTNVATLGQGSFVELTLSAASQIQSNNPVLVAQYANGEQYDGNMNADPSEMQLQPVNLFCNEYVLASDTTDFTPDFLNLVVPNAAVGSVTVNGVAVPAASFAPIAASGYEGAAVTITSNLNVVLAPLPIGVSVYGYANVDCYSFPGGLGGAVVGTPTFSATPTISPTPTPSPSNTSTPTISPTFSVSATASMSPTPTQSATVTPTYTPTALPLLLTPHDPNPNPAGSGGIWLPYTISTAAWVDLEAYDVAGEKVRNWDGDPDFEAEGTHERYWDVRNSSGSTVASGIFLVRIHARSPRNENATVWEKCAVVR